MQSRINAYLSFRDNAREAMQFYQSVFGGKLELSTFKDFGMAGSPSEENKIMHSMLEAENGISFMGADTPATMEYRPGTTMSLALSGDDEAELGGYFKKLSVGGTIREPLMKAPWGDTFGQVRDRYGVDWMVNIAGKKS